MKCIKLLLCSSFLLMFSSHAASSPLWLLAHKTSSGQPNPIMEINSSDTSSEKNRVMATAMLNAQCPSDQHHVQGMLVGSIQSVEKGIENAVTHANYKTPITLRINGVSLSVPLHHQIAVVKDKQGKGVNVMASAMQNDRRALARELNASRDDGVDPIFSGVQDAIYLVDSLLPEGTTYPDQFRMESQIESFDEDEIYYQHASYVLDNSISISIDHYAASGDSPSTIVTTVVFGRDFVASTGLQVSSNTYVMVPLFHYMGLMDTTCNKL